MGKVALFTGVETFNWKIDSFAIVCDYCIKNSIDGLFVKVYEFEAGEWYGGHSEQIVNYIKSRGIECIPYGFFYGGNHWNVEVEALTSLYNKYDEFCLDLEGDWDNNANGSIGPLVNFLKDKTKVLTYVSTWSNTIDHGWNPGILALDPYVFAWMPQEYFDTLVEARLNQWPKVKGEILPTYCVNQVTIDLMAITDYPSIWEYQAALAYPGWMTDFMQHMKGNTIGVKTNNQDIVLDIPFSYQLEPGESQDLCGNFSVAMLAYAGLPNKGTSGNAEQVDQLADYLANTFNSGASGEQGSTIDDMHNYMAYPKTKSGGRLLHWWDCATDKATITKAVKSGYPVIFTANELNIRSTKTGAQPPYPWTLNVNHILVCVGIDSAGNYIVADPLNNNFEGEWPVHYDANVINPSWATIVQVVGPDVNNPWLKPIPSGTPLSWSNSFNAQNFAEGVTVPTNTAYDFNVETVQLWQLVVVGLPRESQGLFVQWRIELEKGINHGSPTGPEKTVNCKDGARVLQPSTSGVWSWFGGKVESWDYKGV